MTTAPERFSDPSLLASLSEEIGHAPPFTDEEIGCISMLSAFDMDSIAELVHFEHVEALNIVGARDGDLDFLSQRRFENLLQISIQHAPVHDLRPMLHPPQLGGLNLRYTKVEDLTPLLEMKHLDEISLEGCPLSEESYFEVLPRLAREDKDTIFGRRPPTIRSLSQEPEWRITRRLHERGLDLCYVRYKKSDRHNFVVVTRSGIVETAHWQGVCQFPAERLLEMIEDPAVDEKAIMDAARQYVIDEL